MITMFNSEDDRQIRSLRDLFAIFSERKSSTKPNNREYKTSMGTNYKKKYLETQKRLELLEKALIGYSNKMKSEARYDLVYGMENRASTLEECSVGIDRIIVKYCENVPHSIQPTGFMYSTGWRPAILWPKLF